MIRFPKKFKSQLVALVTSVVLVPALSWAGLPDCAPGMVTLPNGHQVRRCVCNSCSVPCSSYTVYQYGRPTLLCNCPGESTSKDWVLGLDISTSVDTGFVQLGGFVDPGTGGGIGDLPIQLTNFDLIANVADMVDHPEARQMPFSFPAGATLEIPGYISGELIDAVYMEETGLAGTMSFSFSNLSYGPNSSPFTDALIDRTGGSHDASLVLSVSTSRSLFDDFASGAIFNEVSGGELNAALTAVTWQSVLDFDRDGALGTGDLNELLASGDMISGVPVHGFNGIFDLNSDGVVNRDDANLWRSHAAAANGFDSPYIRGDGNLDGIVDISDFNLWNSHKFTPTPDWSKGDWNADGIVDISDFNLWNAHKFSSSDAAAVPEPTGGLWLGLFLMGALASRRRA